MSKIKKLLFFIIINIVIFIGLLLIFDYVYFKYVYNSYVNSIESEEQRQAELDGHIRYKTFDIDAKDDKTTNVYSVFLEKHYYRDIIIPETTGNINAPILLFGDSYTWLWQNEGFQKQLAECTKRPVYNFAFWGWGAQHMYYLVSKNLLYKIIDMGIFDKKPEYAIYTYIRDHRSRLYPVMDYFMDIEPYLTYEKSKGKLKEKKYSFIHKLLFRLFIYRYYLIRTKVSNDEYSYNMLYDLIVESKKELEKHYPDIKFILLEYYQDKFDVPEETEMFEKLKQNGIEVISTKELTGEDLLNPKYTQPDGYHPNISAWEQIVPALSKKL